MNSAWLAKIASLPPKPAFRRETGQHGQCLMMAGKALAMRRVILGCLFHQRQPALHGRGDPLAQRLLGRERRRRQQHDDATANAWQIVARVV